MSFKLNMFTCSLMLLGLFSSLAYGQLGTASISGTVTDTQGAVVAGARIIAKNVGTEVERETVTSTDGIYSMTNLQPAKYEVRVEAQGFATAVFSDVELEVGKNLAINATLKVAAVEEVIEVVGGTAPVDTTTSEVGEIVSSRTVESLPLNGRNFLDLAFLVPGNAPAPNYDPTKVNTVEVSSAGQVGRGGNIAVDGSDNNDDVVGGTLQNFPQDAIQEFQIVTNRFSAEIGRSASSAINIITKSGSNDLHGSFASFLRHDELQGLPATFDRSQPAPPFDREQYAGTVGGPFYRDKAWWFTAFEFRNQDSVSQVGERDLASRKIIRTSAPAPLNDLLLSTKADWQVNARHSLLFRYALQDEDDIAPGSLRRPLGTAANMQISTNNYQSFVTGWTWNVLPPL